MISPGWLPPTQVEDQHQKFHWQNVGHLRSLEDKKRERSYPTSHHNRTMTEQLSRPSTTSPRTRSNTTVDDYPPTLRKPVRGNEGERTSIDRKSASMSLQSRNERSGSLSRTLKQKASRLLRRQDRDNDDNLTSLRTVDWSSELDDLPRQSLDRQPARHSLSIRRESHVRGLFCLFQITSDSWLSMGCSRFVNSSQHLCTVQFPPPYEYRGS